MRYALVNCDIYTSESVLYDKAIIVNGKYIESVIDINKIPKSIEVIDLNGLNVAPGFIDLQVNGGGGCLFNDDPSEKCIERIYKAHKKFGTTNFLPTLITTSTENILKAINTVKSCVVNDKYGVLGLHLEGPYINEKKSGVHNKKLIREITQQEFEQILTLGKDIIKIVTLAPEKVNESYINTLNEHGIIVSAGHSLATYTEAMTSFKSGVSMVTHLFNAMSQFGSREPGLVGAAFDASDIWASIIADGFHVHFASIRISKVMKRDKLILITDAMPPVGTNLKEFWLDDLKVLYKDGKCLTEDGTLAGSALDMSTAVRNCVQKVGIPLDEALRMASTYPAEILRLSDTLGKIKPGYLANLVIFNNQIIVKGVVINGIYEEVK